MARKAASITLATVNDIAEGVVDIPAIGKRLGVTKHTVYRWRERAPHLTEAEPMPAPAGYVSGRPWWWWPQVEAWAQRTGRAA